MDSNEFVTAAEARRRVETGLLSKFEEIAQTFLDAVSSDSKSDKILFSLQEYLDGTVRLGESIHRRRSVLLTVHDMNEEREAPLSLQSKTLAKLKFLKVDPTPQVRLYQDIATALLKMEVVVRLYASQAVRKSEAGEVPLRGSYALGNPGAPSPALR